MIIGPLEIIGFYWLLMKFLAVIQVFSYAKPFHMKQIFLDLPMCFQSVAVSGLLAHVAFRPSAHAYMLMLSIIIIINAYSSVYGLCPNA